MTALILASESTSRENLLNRLGVFYEKRRPQVDEEQLKTALGALAPRELCLRLARAKAQSLGSSDAIVIGADQIVHYQNQILGKPMSEAQAEIQLATLQGSIHELITSTTIIYKGELFEDVNITRLQMAPLRRDQIARYVKRDQPLSCAGSYRYESLGIALFDQVETSDETAIEGLSLLFVCKTLRQIGFELL